MLTEVQHRVPGLVSFVRGAVGGFVLVSLWYVRQSVLDNVERARVADQPSVEITEAYVRGMFSVALVVGAAIGAYILTRASN